MERRDVENEKARHALTLNPAPCRHSSWVWLNRMSQRFRRYIRTGRTATPRGDPASRVP